uniref:Uncharacterized protein n=1 Tax=Timema bartmani TaxID=61472 RepID=A0A7R9FAG2_9NEOP|nr:unnamed protein product [Timema bartmani]
MLSRLHAVRKAVGAELANSENNIEVLTAVEWKQAAGIVEVLGPLADANKEIRRGRENKENERNLDEGRDGYRRGGGRMMNGPGRGRGGRGGGRLGPRTFQSREKGGFSRPIETWTGSEDTSGESLKMENLGNEFSSTEDWDSETIPGSGTNVGTGNVSDKWGDDFPSPEDWDNEEYTGSLADSKVFTSSGGTMEPVPSNEPLVDLAAQNLSSSVASSSSQMSQSIDIHQAQSQLSQSPIQVGMGTLSAAQSEYLNQLAQASESLKSAGGLGSGSASVSVYGTTSGGYSTTSSTVYQPPSPPSGFAATSGEGNTVVFYIMGGYSNRCLAIGSHIRVLSREIECCVGTERIAYMKEQCVVNTVLAQTQ